MAKKKLKFEPTKFMAKGSHYDEEQADSMSLPTKELMKLILEQRIAHGGHPVLRWNMDNIFIRQDPAGNIKADKAKSTEKIDGAIACIMALDRAIRNGNTISDSVYDSRGLIVFLTID